MESQLTLVSGRLRNVCGDNEGHPGLTVAEKDSPLTSVVSSLKDTEVGTEDHASYLPYRERSKPMSSSKLSLPSDNVDSQFSPPATYVKKHGYKISLKRIKIWYETLSLPLNRK